MLPEYLAAIFQARSACLAPGGAKHAHGSPQISGGGQKRLKNFLLCLCFFARQEMSKLL